jgi:hypothetical protein
MLIRYNEISGNQFRDWDSVNIVCSAVSAAAGSLARFAISPKQPSTSSGVSCIPTFKTARAFV